ncbi:hypothetical protein BGW38_002076 [Lunasporangiospora selenospora]|uniref:Uncharacterized protein n=1 Tax=Lunasporangiospora selenospora TaxID=979761 RepID=A0A9P6G3Z2_9FUNG|nr:hypothetical protein BGW38_002076 [Lunasporangiospora selenospora]
MDASSTTQKRKASSPEASIGATSSEQHDSKKARTTKSSGSKAEQQQHADDCEDPECEGCAEGEIVLQFETTPSATELFQMAREEAAREEEDMENDADGSAGASSGILKPGLSRMAKALYDKALEEFEAFEKANAHIDLHDGGEVAQDVIDTKIQHAACVVAVGNAMPSLEMLEEGNRMFEELQKLTGDQEEDKGKGKGKGKEENEGVENGTRKELQKNGTSLVGSGIAKISLARELRRRAIKAAMPVDEDEQDQKDAFDDEETHRAAATVGKREAGLVQDALKQFERGLVLLKSKGGSVFGQESIRVAQELEEYGVALDMQLNSDLATQVLDSAVQHIAAAQEVNSELVDDNADVLCIKGSCIFSKARLANHHGDESESKRILEEAIQILLKAEEMQGDREDAKTKETLGQAFMMTAVLLEEEDAIMEAYDNATNRLLRALELNPFNDALRQQIDAMQVGDEDEGDGYEDEYEDDDEDDGEVGAEEADDE